MTHIRWYDKIPELKNFLEYLQAMPSEYQSLVAQDLMQILLKEGFVETSHSLDYLKVQKHYEYRRWYDENFELSSALEIIKDLPPQEQQSLLFKIVESIYQIMMEYQNEC